MAAKALILLHAVREATEDEGLVTELRAIKYKRHEFRQRPKSQKGTVLTLVYDIPYFPACGVFPPLHILNQVFSRGGGDGGMGPGASWEPFTLSEEQYEALVAAVKSTPVSDIERYARYANVQMRFDPSFDQIEDWIQWMSAVCKKHRTSWQAELKKAGKIS